jgi:hypothetical protein
MQEYLVSCQTTDRCITFTTKVVIQIPLIDFRGSISSRVHAGYPSQAHSHVGQVAANAPKLPYTNAGPNQHAGKRALDIGFYNDAAGPGDACNNNRNNSASRVWRTKSSGVGGVVLRMVWYMVHTK